MSGGIGHITDMLNRTRENVYAKLSNRKKGRVPFSSFHWHNSSESFTDSRSPSPEQIKYIRSELKNQRNRLLLKETLLMILLFLLISGGIYLFFFT